MEIPDLQTLMLPLLKLLEDGKEHSLKEILNTLAKQFNLTQEQLDQRLPKGNKLFSNRVQWARAYLFKSGLIETPSRATYKITDEGRRVLKIKST